MITALKKADGEPVFPPQALVREDKYGDRFVVDQTADIAERLLSAAEIEKREKGQIED